MADSDTLYRAVGRKIRETRERLGQKLSQEKLAKRLGMSRASIVNIEAGRQHAPLHLLWQIAEILQTDLTLLIPPRHEVLATSAPIQLDKKTVRQIEVAANGNPEARKSLADLVGKLKTTIEGTAPRKGTS
jgi:transcriptional regulator with XRE-family HTH domain